MQILLRIFSLLGPGILHVVNAQTSTNLTSLVNLFIGTAATGNVFPGAAVPHAMAKVSPSILFSLIC